MTSIKIDTERQAQSPESANILWQCGLHGTRANQETSPHNFPRQVSRDNTMFLEHRGKGATLCMNRFEQQLQAMPGNLSADAEQEKGNDTHDPLDGGGRNQLSGTRSVCVEQVDQHAH